MQIQLIRSATLRFHYARKNFIIDPYLAARHTRPSFAGVSPNPLVGLPCAPEEVIAGIEMTLISHLHSDHFDPTAQELLPKELPLFCQPDDQDTIESKGFHNVTPVSNAIEWQGITITRTPCQHGSGEVLKEMGTASGFVFRAENEPTIYWSGDTIWCEPVADIIRQVRPDIIVTHSCGAMWGERVLIVMDAAQTLAVHHAAPASIILAVHMDSLDHATVTRADLRRYAEAHGLGPEKLLIPADGEKLNF